MCVRVVSSCVCEHVCARAGAQVRARARARERVRARARVRASARAQVRARARARVRARACGCQILVRGSGCRYSRNCLFKNCIDHMQRLVVNTYTFTCIYVCTQEEWNESESWVA